MAFAHGSGGGVRARQRRRQQPAQPPQPLLDLLTGDEEHTRTNVFDVLLPARRLQAATGWLHREPALPVAHFGAGTGAAAAPDAGIRAVGSRDTRVLSLNRLAADRLHCEHRLAVVPGATHLFEEPGVRPTLAQPARDWFTSHPSPGRRRAGPTAGRHDHCRCRRTRPMTGPVAAGRPPDKGRVAQPPAVCRVRR
ncbi:hypothetical protein [Streptomyces sp. HUAS ZL42]|uniref:hypothetical protein n=1 Tax=Streptomyces sp. HUAS ZL42 TaxID=3231715 RepID=UPI00345EA622